MVRFAIEDEVVPGRHWLPGVSATDRKVGMSDRPIADAPCRDVAVTTSSRHVGVARFALVDGELATRRHVARHAPAWSFWRGMVGALAQRLQLLA